MIEKKRERKKEGIEGEKKRENRRNQAKDLHAHAKEMREEASKENADVDYCRQCAKEDDDAARKRLQEDGGKLQENGDIDNPTQPDSTSDDQVS